MMPTPNPQDQAAAEMTVAEGVIGLLDLGYSETDIEEVVKSAITNFSGYVEGEAAVGHPVQITDDELEFRAADDKIGGAIHG